MKWISLSLSIILAACSVREKSEGKLPTVFPKIFVDKILSLDLILYNKDVSLNLKSNPLKTDQSFLRNQIIKWGAKSLKDPLFEPDLTFLDEAQNLRTVSDIPRTNLFKIFEENKIEDISQINLKISFTLSFEELNSIKEIGSLIMGLYFFNPGSDELTELSSLPLIDPELKKPIFKIYSSELHPSTTFNFFHEISDPNTILEGLRKGGSFLLGIKDFQFLVSDSYKWSEYRENLKKENYFFYTILPAQINLKVENLKESPNQVLNNNYQDAIFDRDGNLEAMEGLYSSLNHTESAPTNNSQSLKKGLWQSFGSTNLQHLPDPGTSIMVLYSTLEEQQNSLREYFNEKSLSLTDSFDFKNLYLGDQIIFEITGTRSTPQLFPPSKKKVNYYSLSHQGCEPPPRRGELKIVCDQVSTRKSCEITEILMAPPKIEPIKFPEAKNLFIQIGDREFSLKEYLQENPEQSLTQNGEKLIFEMKVTSPKLSFHVKNQEEVLLEYGFKDFGNCPIHAMEFYFDNYDPVPQKTIQKITETYQIKYQKFGVKP